MEFNLKYNYKIFFKRRQISAMNSTIASLERIAASSPVPFRVNDHQEKRPLYRPRSSMGIREEPKRQKALSSLVIGKTKVEEINRRSDFGPLSKEKIKRTSVKNARVSVADLATRDTFGRISQSQQTIV